MNIDELLESIEMELSESSASSKTAKEIEAFLEGIDQFEQSLGLGKKDKIDELIESILAEESDEEDDEDEDDEDEDDEDDEEVEESVDALIESVVRDLLA